MHKIKVFDFDGTIAQMLKNEFCERVLDETKGNESSN